MRTVSQSTTPGSSDTAALAGTVADVERHVRVCALLIGVEGLALLRHLYDGPDDAVDRRLAEIRRILDDDRFLAESKVREADPRAGYRAWSQSYDEPGNPIIAIEQPAVWSLLLGPITSATCAASISTFPRR